MCCVHGENRQRAGFAYLRRRYVLSTAQTSILTLTNEKIFFHYVFSKLDSGKIAAGMKINFDVIFRK